MHYTVAGRGPYVVAEEGDPLATVNGAGDVLDLVGRRCHARLVDHLSLGSWVGLSGCVASVAGRRVLVLGGRGAGKTTLMLRLLLDGHAVEGDELVFTREGDAVCVPRNFQIQPGTVALVPELRPYWPRLPFASTGDGTTVGAFNPSSWGFAWELRRAPVDVAFVLGPRDRGPARCEPVGGAELVQAAIANALPGPVPHAAILRACVALLGGVDGHLLNVGDPAATEAQLVAAAAAT